MNSRFLLIAVLGPSLLAAAPAGAQMLPADVLPPSEIAASVRSLGLRPLTRPHWRGRHYIVRAIDRRGAEMRVVVDARIGEVLSAVPVVREAEHGPQPHPGRERAHAIEPGQDAIADEPRVITGSVSAPAEKPLAKTPLPRPRPPEANAVAELKPQPSAAAPSAPVATAPAAQQQPAKPSRDALPL